MEIVQRAAPHLFGNAHQEICGNAAAAQHPGQRHRTREAARFKREQAGASLDRAGGTAGAERHLRRQRGRVRPVRRANPAQAGAPPAERYARNEHPGGGKEQRRFGYPRAVAPAGGLRP